MTAKLPACASNGTRAAVEVPPIEVSVARAMRTTTAARGSTARLAGWKPARATSSTTGAAQLSANDPSPADVVATGPQATRAPPTGAPSGSSTVPCSGSALCARAASGNAKTSAADTRNRRAIIRRPSHAARAFPRSPGLKGAGRGERYLRLRERFQIRPSAGADPARAGPGRRDHPGLHRRQRLPGAQGRADLRLVDPGGGHLDGAAAALFRSATIYENNIVQTVASAAGTLSSIIFVLPGLVMVGWWTGFPFWPTFVVCAVGGILGVMYSVPLRRALVTESDLPYPEGVAAAEILKVGAVSDGAGRSSDAAAAEENRVGLLTVVWGTLASAGFAAVAATRVFAGELAGYFRLGPSATGIGGSLSLALLGAGHLVGLSVGPGDAGRAGHRLGHRDADPHRAAPGGRVRRPTSRSRSGPTRCASSAPARSASRRSGPWLKLAAPVTARRDLGAGRLAPPGGRRGRRAAAHRARHPDRHRGADQRRLPDPAGDPVLDLPGRRRAGRRWPCRWSWAGWSTSWWPGSWSRPPAATWPA